MADRRSGFWTPALACVAFVTAHAASLAGQPGTTAVAGSSWPDVGSPLPGTGDGHQDAAVIVGIERYSFLARVPGAKKNAKSWVRFLTGSRGLDPNNVRLLTDDEAQPTRILAAVRTMRAKVGPDGRMWFVFIGHGAPAESQDDGLLVTVDARQTVDGVEASSVKQHSLFRELSLCGRPVIAIVDACFSGRASGERGEALVPGLQPSVVRHTTAPDNVVVLTAAASDQFAGPLPGAARPAFSYLALGALRGWGDLNDDGVVTAGEVASYSAQALDTVLQGERRQKPELVTGPSDLPLSVAKEASPSLTPLVTKAQPTDSAAPIAASTPPARVASCQAGQHLEKGLCVSDAAPRDSAPNTVQLAHSIRARAQQKQSEWAALEPVCTDESIPAEDRVQLLQEFLRRTPPGHPGRDRGQSLLDGLERAELGTLWVSLGAGVGYVPGTETGVVGGQLQVARIRWTHFQLQILDAFVAPAIDEGDGFLLSAGVGSVGAKWSTSARGATEVGFLVSPIGLGGMADADTYHSYSIFWAPTWLYFAWNLPTQLSLGLRTALYSRLYDEHGDDSGTSTTETEYGSGLPVLFVTSVGF